MKKSKKFKKWLNDAKFIKKQNALPLEERTMGNAKPHCYTCVYAGYIFNIERACLEPYCTKYSHQGKIHNLSITKWNDSFDDRTRNYEERVISKRAQTFKIA